MILRSLAKALSLLAVVLLVVQPCFGFQSRLSDESVREAYFLGQRHDETFAWFLGKYTKYLPPPKTGPHISSLLFSTPFAQLVQRYAQLVGPYTAQQAQADHRNQQEFVRIEVRIQLTNSYSAFMYDPSVRRVGSSPVLIARPSDFWKGFQVQVYNGNEVLSPSIFRGRANWSCGRRGPCALTGATLELEFPPDAFTADSATIEVSPPEGDPVSVKFDLFSLR